MNNFSTIKLLRLSDPQLESAPKHLIAAKESLARMQDVLQRAEGFHSSSLGNDIQAIMRLADRVLGEMLECAVAKVRK